MRRHDSNTPYLLHYSQLPLGVRRPWSVERKWCNGLPTIRRVDRQCLNAVDGQKTPVHRHAGPPAAPAPMSPKQPMPTDLPAKFAHQPGMYPTAARLPRVDDEPRIRDFIARALSAAGYAIDFACNGSDGLRQAVAGDYDLVILDLVMPDMDGREILAELRRERPEQAVLVLSCLSDVTTKVDCLELGAQDYLTKPFSLAELLARELMEHLGQSVTKGQLLASVWGYDFDPGSNVVDVCVRRIRSKLGFDLIKTVRGEGYQLAS